MVSRTSFGVIHGGQNALRFTLIWFISPEIDMIVALSVIVSTTSLQKSRQRLQQLEFLAITTMRQTFPLTLMTKVVHLLGEHDAVYLAIADRLERAGATFSQNIEDADLIIAVGRTSLTTSEIDIAVIPAKEKNPNAKLIFRVHDILVPQQVNGWGSKILSDWVDWVKDGSEGNPPEDVEARHWVHIRDATDAITQISLTEADTAVGVIDLAGRRAWVQILFWTK